MLPLLLASLLSAADGAPVDLAGFVGDAEGKPLAGATVAIRTALPRQGSSPRPPSEFADCGKRARTDARGKVVIAGLDPALVFQVLVVADGFQPRLFAKVDPAARPLEARLIPSIAETDTQKTLRGRVVDSGGRPLADATIEPFGIRDGERRQWGGLKGIEPLAVTNERGEFVVHGVPPGAALDVKVEALRFAPQSLETLEAGKPHEIVLKAGAIVRGRVVQEGQPVPELALGIAHADRAAGKFKGHFEVGTDAQGNFEFRNIPPDADYFLYSRIDGRETRGALPVFVFPVPADDTVSELGTLALEPTHRLSGRVMSVDGKPLPAGTRLLLGRERAWDTQTVVLGSDGRFEFAAVPAEALELIIRAQGYRFVPGRNKFQQTREDTLGLFADRDHEDVWIYLQPLPPDAKGRPR